MVRVWGSDVLGGRSPALILPILPDVPKPDGRLCCRAQALSTLSRCAFVKVSLIVPVLYSEPDLQPTLLRLASLQDRVNLEVFVVVDIPDARREDEARAAIEDAIGEVDAIPLYRVGERGFGSALRDGFAKAGGDVLIPFMADACDDPEDVPRLVEAIDKGWDVVAGSRYMKGGRIVGNTPKQRMSRLYSWLVRLAGGPKIHDVSNAFKAYRRTVIESVETTANSFDVSVELAVKANQANFRVGEIPTVWRNRKLGTSNFDVSSEIKNYGRWLLLALKGRLPKKASRLRDMRESS